MGKCVGVGCAHTHTFTGPRLEDVLFLWIQVYKSP